MYQNRSQNYRYYTPMWRKNQCGSFNMKGFSAFWPRSECSSQENEYQPQKMNQLTTSVTARCWPTIYFTFQEVYDHEVIYALFMKAGMIQSSLNKNIKTIILNKPQMFFLDYNISQTPRYELSQSQNFFYCFLISWLSLPSPV